MALDGKIKELAQILRTEGGASNESTQKPADSRARRNGRPSSSATACRGRMRLSEFMSWDYYRSPLAHGFQERTRDTVGTPLHAYSRLTAALHILLTREAGVAGPLAKSILESDEVVAIPVMAGR